MEDSFKNIRNLDLKGNYTSNVMYDGSVRLVQGGGVRDIFDSVSIYESLFFGEEFDDLWTAEDTISEILKYYNLHIRQEGFDYYIYHRSSIGNDIDWTAIISGSDVSQQQQYSETQIWVIKPNEYLMFNGDAHELLQNQSTGQVLPGKTLTYTLSRTVTEENGVYKQYYYFTLPNGLQVKSDKYITVDQPLDNMTFIDINGNKKILIQDWKGNYPKNELDAAPQNAYENGVFKKNFYRISSDSYLETEI